LCTVIAVVDGEEEFTDANANGVYDLGESFVDTYDDIHIEKDDDSTNVPFGTESAGNPFDSTFEDLVVDRNQDGLFNGMNGAWDSNKRIVKRINLLITGEPRFSLSHSSVIVPNGGSDTVYFSVHDANYNPLIAGSSFAVSTDGGGKLSGATAGDFLDTSVPGAPIYAVAISDSDVEDTDPPEAGSLTFTITWKGNDYLFSIPTVVD
jgi:hypothetical protein